MFKCHHCKSKSLKHISDLKCGIISWNHIYTHILYTYLIYNICLNTYISICISRYLFLSIYMFKYKIQRNLILCLQQLISPPYISFSALVKLSREFYRDLSRDL